MYIARRVLGQRYRHEFYVAEDGRSREEIDADVRLEKYKMWVDGATLLVPIFGGLINNSAYWFISRVRK